MGVRYSYRTGSNEEAKREERMECFTKCYFNMCLISTRFPILNVMLCVLFPRTLSSPRFVRLLPDVSDGSVGHTRASEFGLGVSTCVCDVRVWVMRCDGACVARARPLTPPN